MYKIDKQLNNKQLNKKNEKELSRDKQMINDLVYQDISKLHLTTSKCPVYPNTYSNLFNKDNKLDPMSPYKVMSVKHKRDGKPITKIEYNDFYSDKNLNKDVWLWNNDNKYMISSSARNNQTNHPITLSNYPNNKSLEIYEQTRRKDQFAQPLPINGTNEVNILFNDKCIKNTFGFRRYASEPVNNTTWFNNKLYDNDISKETIDLKANYMVNLVDNSMNLYDSVFQDMYHMTTNPVEGDTIDKLIASGSINKIRNSY